MRVHLPFHKYEGLGNDFVLVDEDVGPERAARLCDRRRGIGADGVLVVGRAPPSMKVYNADGSVPEMCGNGLRCVARYLHTRHGQPPEMTVETGAGPRPVRIRGDEVEVGMGAATDRGREDVERFVGRRVDTGNPHLVLLRTEPWPDELFRRLGPALQVGGGVNVSFAERLGPDHVRLRVWERGAGPTLACGTGACATVATGWWTAQLHGEVRVDLPGGTLRIGGTPAALVMTGPAREVFSGVWPESP